MSYNLIWIFLLILLSLVTSFPLPNHQGLDVIGIEQEPMNSSPKIPKYEDSPDSSDEKVISVRITSSVAIGRGRGKTTHRHSGHLADVKILPKTSPSETHFTTVISRVEDNQQGGFTDVPPNLIGANIEYIKQLNAKKETREHGAESVHPFQLMAKGQHDNDYESSTKIDEYEDITDIPLARKVPSTANANQFQEQNTNRRYTNPDISHREELYAHNNYHINVTNDSLFDPSNTFGLRINSNDNKNVENFTLPINDEQSGKNTFVSNSNNYQNDDSLAESSIKSVEFAKYNEEIEDISPTVSVPLTHPSNNLHSLTNRPQNKGRGNSRLTTVSFNIVHDASKVPNDNEPSSSFVTSSQIIRNQQQFYEPPKIYSEPAKIYSEPAKFYSEPAKVYSEPAKVYSEPAKVYSEPAKIYSEPSKFYSEPASLHLNENVAPSIPPNYSPWQGQPSHLVGSTTINTTPLTTVTNAFQRDHTQREHQPEKNYEVDENISVLTDGRSYGVQQETTTEKCKQDNNCKVGYVVEGRQFKKYRVEERTPDGFIVGEYGVVRNEDGALRGVRYTADGDASPRLIHDALMKFLQLK